MRLAHLAIAGVLLLCACSQNNVYVASNTLIGLNAGVNPAKSTGQIFFGYERDFVAIIPKAVEQPAGEDDTRPTGPVVEGVSWKSEEGKELMAVLGCTDVKAEGIFIRRFTEYLATGQAARNYAVALRLKDVDPDDVIDEFFKCLKKPAATTGSGGINGTNPA